MNKKYLIFTILIVMLATSCSTPFYQVYKASSSDKVVLKDKLLVFEDDNCKVLYNLWDEGGNIGFTFYNKTETTIYINLKESFFILNGVANNYYKNRVYIASKNLESSVFSGLVASKSITGLNYSDLIQTNNVSTSKSSGIKTSSGFSTSYAEEEIVIIPSKTSKSISEYSINELLFRDCNLFRYPTRKQIVNKTFTKSDSPFIFSNRIQYKIGKEESAKLVENDFYIKEIGNYPESEILELVQDEFCNQKTLTKTKYFKNVSADKFYIKYSKGQDRLKH
ncbi:hypothetical protein VP395_08160 [Mariniflexile soesokkakense]|uniref:Lipoprotein n=1 Tax=Mariniflexile soesokkakense TaxID=1343160 RepID=A0ABV0AA36_9FLAO